MTKRPISNFIGVPRDGSEGTARLLREHALNWAQNACEDAIPKDIRATLLAGDGPLTEAQQKRLEDLGIRFQFRAAKANPRTADDAKTIWSLQVPVETGRKDIKRWHDVGIITEPVVSSAEDDEPTTRITLQSTGYEEGPQENGHLDGTLPEFITDLIKTRTLAIADNGGRLHASTPAIINRPVNDSLAAQKKDPHLAAANTISRYRGSVPIIVFTLPRSIKDAADNEARIELAKRLAAKLSGQARVFVFHRKDVVANYKYLVGHLRARHEEGVTVHLPGNTDFQPSAGFGRNTAEDLIDVERRITDIVYEQTLRNANLFDFDTVAPVTTRREGKIGLGQEASQLVTKLAAAEERATGLLAERDALRRDLAAAKVDTAAAERRAATATRGIETANARAARAEQQAASLGEDAADLREQLATAHEHQQRLVARIAVLLGGSDIGTRILRPEDETEGLGEGLHRLAARNVLVIGEPDKRKVIELPADVPESLEPEVIQEFLRGIELGDGRTAADNLEFTDKALKGYQKAAREHAGTRDVAQIYAALVWLATRTHGRDIETQKSDLKQWLSSPRATIDPSYSKQVKTKPEERFVVDHRGEEIFSEDHLKLRDSKQSRIYFTREKARAGRPKETPRRIIITDGPEHI